MKKMVVFFVLLALLTTAVFAELSIGFEASVNTDLLYYSKGSFTGPDTEDMSKQKEYGKDDKGSLNFFNSNTAWGPGTGLSLTFTYNTENTEASVQLDLGDLLKRKVGNLIGDNAETATWQDILDGGFGDWYFKGNLNALDGYVGNTGYGGKVDTFDNFNDFINADEKFNQLGGFGLYKLDGWKGSDGLAVWGDEIFALGASFGNFKVAGGSALKLDGFKTPFKSKASANAAFIFSGDGIADLITFDLFYAVMGQDENTIDRDSGNGSYENRFGVYAGLNLGALGIGFGYSGNVTLDEAKSDTAEADKEKAKAIPITNPFYSGIDLHVNFTGVNKLGVTFNNNISFAAATGIKDNGKEKYVTSISGIPNFGENDSENWFAYHGGIIATYALSDDLSVAFQVADKIGVFTSKSKPGDKVVTDTLTTNELRFALSGEYTVKFAKFGCGLNIGLSDVSIKNEAATTTENKANVFTLGIPMYFKVSW